MVPESFQSHQSDLFLNSAFLEDLDEELVSLVRIFDLEKATLPTNNLVSFVDQISNSFQ